MNESQGGTWQELKIPLKDLYLWDENARFPDKYFNKSDEELISYFCSKNEFKIESLAKEIVKDFDLPQLEKLVVLQADEKYIVLEGNRRLTAYKLLCNPNLSPSEELKNKFLQLKEENTITEYFPFDCLVTTNELEGYRYIDRKHVKGNNEVGWGTQERVHHKHRRGTATKKEEIKIEIGKIIKHLDVPDELKGQVLGPGYVTTFWRILDSSAAIKKFGFDFSADGGLEISDKNFKEQLKVIILNVLQKKDFSGKKIDSRSLNSRDAIQDYLESINDEAIDIIDEEIKKCTTSNLFGESTVNVGNVKAKRIKITPKSTTRKYLIPRDCRLEIPETKINNIYHELMCNLLLDDSEKAVPNAVGVLFRVFLEICIDYFAEKKGITFKNDLKLAGKITLTADFMESVQLANQKQLKNIRTVATDKHNLLSIDNFHGYVHSYKSQPSSSDLKLKWDNLQEFFILLWDCLKSKK